MTKPEVVTLDKSSILKNKTIFISHFVQACPATAKFSWLSVLCVCFIATIKIRILSQLELEGQP
jgi:hypothetical protein